jgi:cephalosporin hydroxylase
MSEFERTLDEIGLATGTDKSSRHHDFLQLYERVLRPLRHEPITLLEIGVYDGGSVRMWAEFFPDARIIGVDIDHRTKAHEADRIVVEIADQSNVEHLHDVCMRHGPFDVVIDDGSHVWDHQITTLREVFPHVKPRGFFILEDLDTSHGSYRPRFKGRGCESAAAYLQRLVDAMVGDEVIDLNSELDDFIRSYARRLDYVLFSRRTSIIRRK